MSTHTKPCAVCGEKQINIEEEKCVACAVVARFEKHWEENPRQKGEGLCPVCHTPGCDHSRHKGVSFDSLTCDYAGEPPFAKAEWAGSKDAACLWCAGTGHPYGDESFGMCKCPAAQTIKPKTP